MLMFIIACSQKLCCCSFRYCCPSHL